MIKLRNETVDILQKLQITTFTQVQQLVIPQALASHDIYAISPTGSGKTLSYLLPVLERIDQQGKGKHFPYCLIIAPTRELCIQITHVIRSILQNREGIRTALLTGGYDIQKQIHSFKSGADIVVGTPSRILDHLRRHTLKLNKLDTLIIDEADLLVSMGFLEDTKRIIEQLPKHQTMLFTATDSPTLSAFSSAYLQDPFTCKIQKETYLKQDIQTTIIEVQEKKKLDILLKQCQKNKKTLIFANTRKTCDFISDFLQKKHLQVDTIHSDMDYTKRRKIMDAFRNDILQILCATDVAARGIDIPSVQTVILYDLPETKEQLIHRTGRAGRSFHHGNVFLYITPKQKHMYDFKHLLKDVTYLKK